MFNPPSSLPDFGSYQDLLKKITQRFMDAHLDEQIMGIFQSKYEEELSARNIMLSRPERNRLYKQVVKAVLTEMLSKLEA
jgi:hypothetical protein